MQNISREISSAFDAFSSHKCTRVYLMYVLCAFEWKGKAETFHTHKQRKKMIL